MTDDKLLREHRANVNRLYAADLLASMKEKPMTERVNKLYKLDELVAAQKALVRVSPATCGITLHEASRILIELHKIGYRVVYVGKDSE